jgi:two-component system LytT family response regulator
MRHIVHSLSNDEKIIEKIHRWLNPSIDVVIGMSSQELELSLDLINKIKPQVLILDISSSTSYSYQLIEKLNREHFGLVVISDNPEDAIKGISYGIADFLLKPLTEERLEEAVNKAIIKLEEKKFFQTLKRKHEEVEQGKEANEVISLPLLKGKSIKLKVENIIRFESIGTMTKAYLKKSLKEFTSINTPITQCEVLLRNHDFFRIHRKHLVNFKSINFFNEGKEKSITLHTGVTLPIARRRYSEFVSQYDEFRSKVEKIGEN